MTHTMSVILAAFSVAVSLANLSAQTDAGPAPFGLIIKAAGSDVAVYRDGNLTDFDLSQSESKGIPLFAGDLVQTGPETSLEIEFFPSLSTLSVAANTTFRLVSLDTSGACSLDLVYGRLRARVHLSDGTPSAKSAVPFSIKGASAVADVTGADFGYDVMAVQNGGAQPVTKVYCVSGIVKVTRSGPGSDRSTPAVSIGPAKMVVVDPGAGIAPLQAEDISRALSAYWEGGQLPTEPMTRQDAVKRFPNIESAVAEWSSTHPSAETSSVAGPVQTPTAQTPAVPASPAPTLPAKEGAQSPSSAGPAEASGNQPQPEPSGTVLSQVMPPHPKESHTVRNIGLGVSIGGVVVGVAGTVLYFFGPAIFPALTPSTNTTISGYTLIGGGVLLASGLIVYLIGEAARR